VSADERPLPGHGRPADEEIARLRRELSAVNLERLRLRSELEQVRLSPLGRLIDPARTVRSVVDRQLWRLSRLLRNNRFVTLRRGRRRAASRRLPPPLSGSELAWLARRRLRPQAKRWASTAPTPPSGEWLTPTLVDCFARDGSTLLMALLATSSQIVVDEKYPYERRYFTYLWRWSRLLSRADWPSALWTKNDVVSISQEQQAALLGPPPWLPRDLFRTAPAGTPISQRCFELAWSELSARAVKRAQRRYPDAATPRYYAEKHANTWRVDLRELPPVKVIVLLRDPRDTYASIGAFEGRGPASFALHHEWAGQDRLPAILERHRQRLRWIAKLLEQGQVPVIRFEELIGDLRPVALRLEQHLGVSLNPDALKGQELASRHASSAGQLCGRWRRDLDPETAERFNSELGPELEAMGFRA
jgi:hypothetical protein